MKNDWQKNNEKERGYKFCYSRGCLRGLTGRLELGGVGRSRCSSPQGRFLGKTRGEEVIECRRVTGTS